jgi:hypothetical protein
MNLRERANRATQRVNPNLSASILKSTGYTTALTGKRAPSYAPAAGAIVQFQALTKEDIKHLDALNVSGTQMSAYVNQQLSGPDRVKQIGGDMIQFGTDTTTPADLQGTQWYVTAVLEGWSASGWCKVGITRQMPQ